jgi:hypothetical protein
MLLSGKWIWIDDTQRFRVHYVQNGKFCRADSVSAFSRDIAAAMAVQS